MCFAPQRRALLQHLNFQKWSDAGVFCTFWLQNVLRATTACNFSSLIWPAGSAPAALASLLFDPPEPQIIGKNAVFRNFPTFSRICIFFLLTLSLLIFSLLIFIFSLPLPCSAFHLSILSEVWLLNFLRIGLHRHRPQIEKVGTDGSQRGNQRLPWQGTAGSQTLKLTVPNLGTNGLPLQRTSVS